MTCSFVLQQALVPSPPFLPFTSFFSLFWRKRILTGGGGQFRKVTKENVFALKSRQKGQPRVSRRKWHSELTHFPALSLAETQGRGKLRWVWQRSDGLSWLSHHHLQRGSSQSLLELITKLRTLARLGQRELFDWGRLNHRKKCFSCDKNRFSSTWKSLKAAGISISPWNTNTTTSILPLPSEPGHRKTFIKHVKTDVII